MFKSTIAQSIPIAHTQAAPKESMEHRELTWLDRELKQFYFKSSIIIVQLKYALIANEQV